MPCICQLSVCLALALTYFGESFAASSFEDDNIATFGDNYILKTEKNEIEGLEYTLHNFTFSVSEKSSHNRVKRLQGAIPGTTLCVMTFNIRTYSPPQILLRGKDIIIAHLLNSADLIGVQEMKNMNAAPFILNLLNIVAGAPGTFNMVQSAALPGAFVGVPPFVFNLPNRRIPPSEHYAFFYRTAILSLQRQIQPSPILLADGANPLYQTRPPLVAEFTYSLGMSSFDFTVVNIHTKPGLNPLAEINALHNVLNTVINFPHCYSSNAIIMGDFNQGTNFIPAALQSSLDLYPQSYHQLMYFGGSTAAVNPPQKHDRIYVHGHFTQVDPIFGRVIPSVNVNGDQALVQTFWLNNMGIYNPIQVVGRGATSDHYPVIFQVNAPLMATYQPWLILGCGPLAFPAALPGPAAGLGRKRRAMSNCEECLSRSLTGGIFPPGAIRSDDALNVIPDLIGRENKDFLNFIQLRGAIFVFLNEEHRADWCGRKKRACRDCRGATGDISIVDQCADRIMCPNLAVKLLELRSRLQSCIGNNRTIIVHEAWDEPDSVNPNGLNSIKSLHGQGLEAKISVSEVIETLPIIERRDYSSDNSFLTKLSSLALCVGFGYIKINSDNTLSVAVEECFNSQTRIPLCTKPFINDGKYKGAHEGPNYQLGEYISAVCLPGYRLEGPITRRCLGINGTNHWSEENSVCVKVCQHYEEPQDICVVPFIDLINNFVELKCLYNCDPSCQRSYLKCNHTSRKFENVEFSYCVAADNSTCGIPPDPYNGFSEVIGGIPGAACSVVEFSCNNGSNLVGNPVVTCQPNGEFSDPLPSCTGDVQITDFKVPGFQYFRASKPVNLQDPSSLSSATYFGELHGPFPSLSSGGRYNTSMERVIFEEGFKIPFVGLSLTFRTDVKLNLFSYITDQFFHGRLENPFFVDVTGRFDGLSCLLTTTGLIDLPAQGLTIQTDLLLEFCDNCSYICNAQAVSVMVDLALPWNLTLHGSYMLSDNITEVVTVGEIEISNIAINVSIALQSQAGQLSVKEIALDVHLQSPIDLDMHGSYYRSSGQAVLSGILNLPIVILTLELTIDIEAETISALKFSGSISSPLLMSVFGSYSLEESNSSHLIVGGSVDVPGLINLRGTLQLDLLTRMILDFSFEGMLAEPLLVMVSGHYNTENMNVLKLSGSTALLSNTMITFNVKLNTSDPISVEEISLVGNFPPPLDFILYNGHYNKLCSCAILTGRAIQSFITVVASTNLYFAVNQTHLSISELQIQVTFHRPVNLQLTGLYRYSNGTNSNTVDVIGQFNIPQFMLSTELQLSLEGMSSFTLSQLHFSGRIPSPLLLDVQGDYNVSTNDLILSGSLQYDFAQLNASVLYSFRDDVHNTSSMLSNVSFIGRLLDPFQLDIQGHYIFASSKFMLGGVLNLNQYLTLRVDVSLNTSTSPPSIDIITLSGVLITPISFQGEFRGIYNRQTREGLLHSHLDIMGALLLDATASLTLGQSNEFSLESVSIEGSLESPLSIKVAALYVPSNTTELDLMGHMSIGPVLFMVIAHAEKKVMMNQLVIKQVTISGKIQSPFSLMLSGIYMAGNTLLLRGALDFTELHIMVMAPVNLTKLPREISSFQFNGLLTSPFNASVSGKYSSGEDLILSGMLDIGALHFTVDVIFNTSSILTVNRLRFMTSYNPLSLALTGSYDQATEKLELTGMIEIPSFNIIAMADIDMSREVRSLSTFTMSVKIEQPPISLSGVYDPSTRNALLQGELTLSALKFRASALLSLGANRHLQQIMFSLNFTIPFGSNLQFMLTGTYDNNREWLILESRIAQNTMSPSDTHALVIASTSESPTLHLVSLIIRQLDIGSLVSQYIGISWPANAFPLVFSNIAIYQANTNLMYDAIDYKTGFHARGEVKIFVFPEIIIDASLIRDPSPQFRVSFQLKRVLDWGILAICGSTDTFCNMTGPSLSMQVGSGMNQFIFEGGFRLFNINVGTSQLIITKNRMSATFMLSEQITQHFFGLDPGPIMIYWNNEGFHSNLKIPGLMIQNFKFTNVRSRDICRKLSVYISEFVIDAPFHLDSSFVVREIDNNTFFLGVIFSGYVELDILNEPILNVSITPKSIGIRIQKGQQLSWNLFLKMLEQGLLSAGQQILDDLVQDSRAVALMASGKLGQLAVGQAAQAICRQILEEPPPESEPDLEPEEPEPAEPEEPFMPEDFPEVPDTPFDAPIIRGGVVIGGTAELGAEEVVFLGGIAVGGGAAVTCFILKIFGGCSSSNDDMDLDMPDRDEKNIEKVQAMLRQTCDSHLCDHICQDSGDLIQCSCRDGYYLDSDQHSCIRYDRCRGDSNPCDTNAHCMDPFDMNQITCTCFTGYTGDGRTCSDVNECTEETAECPSHSTCHNTVGSFICNCDSGYRKITDMCEDIDECSEGTASCPAEHSHCTNTPGNYQCDCDMGFMRNGSSCIDVNECSSEAKCGPHSICTNTIGSFSCQCELGYRQNGSICMDVDECSESTSCDQNAFCINTDGSFNCMCMKGYSGNGTHCLDINECLVDGVCTPHSVCSNTQGSFTCMCNEGFTLSENFLCEDIDECDTSMFDCIPEAMCENTIGSYQCTCLPGYTGNGTVCEDIDECNTTASICSPYATCMNEPGTYFCQCDSGFMRNGTSCADIDECMQLDMCDQFASCENTKGSYTCTCNTGFIGDGHICSEITCPVITPPPDTEYVTNEGYMFNQNVVLRCVSGYMPASPTLQFNLTCTSLGQWSADLPSCIPVPGTNLTVLQSAVFGGSGGIAFDDNNDNIAGIIGMKIRSGNQIDSIQVTYRLKDESTYEALMHGGTGGSESFFTLADGEKLIRMEGMTSGVLVDMLTFYSNYNNTYGPYGVTGQKRFSVAGLEIVAFFGRAGNLLDAIGAYVSHCDSGFMENGTMCTDIDECGIGSDNCDVNAVCANTYGSFTCTCRFGLSGDGVTCNASSLG